MRSLRRLIPLISLLAILFLGWLIIQIRATEQSNELEIVIDSAILPTLTPFAEPSWIKLNLPEYASQLERGAEIYRLVCSACHAYDGTGLTDEWRATWTEDAQNCWQSKCHGENHPPDGFFLPHSPAVVGPIIPALFDTAYDLYQYNQYYMPWQNPNSLTEDEAWAVTAYVLELNQFDPGPFLDAEGAKKILLRR